MKKLELSNIIQGVRKLGAVKATLEHIQEAYTEALADIIFGLLASSSGPTALHGCVNSGSGSDYNISAGAIFYNDEVYEVSAFVGTAGGGQVPVLSIVTSYRSGDPVKYSDNNNYNTHQIRTMVWTLAVSGSGLTNFSALTKLKDRVNSNLLDVPGQINTAISNLVAAAPGTLDTLNELANALGSDPNFATTMTNALAGKVAKAGDSMTGALAMGNNKVTGLAAGTAAGDAARYDELNVEIQNRVNGDTLKVSKAGDSMTGALAMGNNKITGLAAANASGEAVRYDELQQVAQTVTASSGVDHNAFTTPGLYYAGGMNAPNGATAFFLAVVRDYDSHPIVQISIPLNTANIGTIYTRQYTTSWSAWTILNNA